MRHRIHKIVIGGVLAGAFVFVTVAGLSGAGGNVLHVPRDYSTIQTAVDAAQPGDTVLVAAGVYSENVVVSTSGVRLQGGGGAVMDGTGLSGIGIGIHVLGGAAVPITGVEVSNFEVRNYERGITLELATALSVSHNYVHDNLDKAAPQVLGDGFGMELTNVSASDVSHNIISGNGFGGVRLSGLPSGSTNNTLHHNRVFDNGAQAPNLGGAGFTLTGPSNDNRIEYNDITGNLGRGIVLGRPSGTDPIRGMLIAHNRLENNQRAGIAIMGSANFNTVVYNDARGNNLAGIGPCWRCNLFDLSPGRNGGNIWDQNHGTWGTAGSPCHGPLAAEAFSLGTLAWQ